MIKNKVKALLVLIITVSTTFLTAFSPLDSFTDQASTEADGVFSCVINDKPYVIQGVHATLRKITDGQRQLSFSNDRFVKFMFLNPTVKKIDLASGNVREACIRYEDPATSLVCKPVKGFVDINTLDESKNLVSGEFEMELVMLIAGKEKVIKVTQGKLTNIPIKVY